MGKECPDVKVLCPLLADKKSGALAGDENGVFGGIRKDRVFV
jgi:hypothetical protein